MRKLIPRLSSRISTTRSVRHQSAGAGSAQPPAYLRVVIVMRRRGPGQFSVERVFRDITSALPGDLQVSVVEVPFPSRGVLPRLRNMLFTARIRADVVHIAGDIQYCALAVCRSRSLLTILDLVSLRRLSGWRRRVLFLLWYRFPVRRATAVTAISEAVRDELLDLLPTAHTKTTVIGCPVSPEFGPAPDGAHTSDLFQVLLVGSNPNKNLGRVAAALQGLPVHLHVVGRVHDDQRRMMDQLGLSHSQAAGLSDSEMRTTYQNCSALVFASTYEGFGLPILEAQACGIPVVTSAIPPMCDVAGGAAVLVDPWDVASIRGGVEALLGDAELRARLSEAGRLNAARYSPTRIAAEYADSYRLLADMARVSNSGGLR